MISRLYNATLPLHRITDDLINTVPWHREVTCEKIWNDRRTKAVVGRFATAVLALADMNHPADYSDTSRRCQRDKEWRIRSSRFMSFTCLRKENIKDKKPRYQRLINPTNRDNNWNAMYLSIYLRISQDCRIGISMCVTFKFTNLSFGDNYELSQMNVCYNYEFLFKTW